jgi:hypothetical protein
MNSEKDFVIDACKLLQILMTFRPVDWKIGWVIFWTEATATIVSLARDAIVVFAKRSKYNQLQLIRCNISSL